MKRLKAQRVRRRLERLCENPDNERHKALKGKYKGKFSLRVAKHYRIIYSLDRSAREVTVHQIGHRSKVYSVGSICDKFKTMQNLTQLPFYVSYITIDMVHWFLDLFDELGIKVWIDGGWGVDALLGECTREHSDLDIIISWEDSAILTEALSARGFVDIHTDDRKDRNFVMGHRLHGKIDFHVIERTENGGAVYGPGEIDWIITESELDAVGSIGGRKVRCLSVDYQVRSHTGYILTDTDFADLRALQKKYDVKLLPTQIKEAS